MNESADQARSAGSTSGVTIQAGGNVGMRNAAVAGRDYVDNRKRNVRIGVGFGSLAIVLLYFGIHAALGSATDVVYQAGVQGATGTVQQLQKAEQNGDSSSWCFLASSHDSSTCEALISNGYTTTQSQQLRDQISQITIGSPSGSGGTYTYNLIYQGRNYPVQMTWTGQRWELNPMDYYGALNDGGMFLAVIETAQGKGAFLGVPTN